MGHWNYRVVLHKKDHTFEIHEAYYEDGEKEPHMISTNGMSPHGETFDELKSDLEKMVNALDKPILIYEDF